MAEEQDLPDGLSRRELIKRTLCTGVYATPAILSMSVVTSQVAAATPPGAVCTQPVSYLQDAVLVGVFPGATFDLYYQPSNVVAPIKLPAPFVADAFGVATALFPLSIDTSVVTSVTLMAYLTGTAPPAPAAATFPSRLVTLLTCQPGGPLAGAAFLATIIQEPTAAACTSGVLNQWREVVDVNLVNAPPGVLYDVYIRPNNIVGGAFAKAGTLPITNGQGNTGAILPVVINTTAGNPASVIVNVVPAGMPATPATYTFTAAPTGDAMTTTLITVSCAGSVTTFSAPKPLLLAVR